MDDAMQRITWNNLLTSLTLVRLGQELGTDGPLPRAVADLVSIALSFLVALYR
jgi:hypothetical protein